MGAKGKPKTGGMKKGFKFPETLNAEAIARELNCDPFEVLIRFTAGDWEGLGYDSPEVTKVLKDGGTIMVERITPEMRLTAAKEAVRYLYPQRKAIEMSTDEQKGFAIVIKDYTSTK